MYHYELRKFPHTFCVFNQSEQQLRAIVAPWTTGEWVEVGERTWNIHETKLTILDGPELSLQEMAMSRGWRNARRRSDDVTERVLAGARAASGASRPSVGPGSAAAAGREAANGEIAPAGAAAPAGADGEAPDGARRGTGELELLADSLALEVLGALDEGPTALARVWRLAQARLSDRPASESLALAEHATRSLLARGLVVLRRRDVDAGSADAAAAFGSAAIEAALRDIESWSAADDAPVSIARKG